MPGVKIISDSTCDLSRDLIEKYNIDIVPMHINLGGKIAADGEISPEDIYTYVEKTGELPGTIAVSIEDFKKAFLQWRDRGYDVVCNTISSEMSCSFQNARIAAQEVGEGIYLVDSRNLSTGIGHVVLKAAEMAEKGMDARSIVDALHTLIPKVSSSFVIDTLEYLKKGGRCSSIMLLGANLLKIKPSIYVKDGVMSVGHKFRGPLNKVLMEYVDMQLSGRFDISLDRIFITHTGCSPEIIEAVRSRIEHHMHFNEVLVTRAGCTITCHSGPNTLGILFIEK